MYEVSVEARFSAAHRVRLPNGELEPVHGHDWQVMAVFAGAKLDEWGMLVDFVLAQEKLEAVIGRLNHTDLGECPSMQGLNPTAEHVAKIVFAGLAEDERLQPVLHRVRVTEAPGCRAVYLGGS